MTVISTFATLFSGGELAGVGLRNLGLRHLWGVEINAEIASVAEVNGFSTYCLDVLNLDPRLLTPPDVLHASPPCTSASNANQRVKGVKETPADLAFGRQVSLFISVLRPQLFTLENVWLYRNFSAFKLICQTLDQLGYFWHVAQVNAADYGVPQTRKRLILRAKLDGFVPPLPAAVAWRGWYPAVEDLLPSLPESQFAPWQLARLPDDVRQHLLVDGQNARADTGVPTLRYAHEPAFTVSAGGTRAPTRALLLPGAGNTNFRDAKPGAGVRYSNEPAHTVPSGGGGRISRAWLGSGRVVMMTPRALARFQSVPDSYFLPENVDLARRIIGNGVPCLLLERLYSDLIQ